MKKKPLVDFTSDSEWHNEGEPPLSLANVIALPVPKIAEHLRDMVFAYPSLPEPGSLSLKFNHEDYQQNLAPSTIGGKLHVISTIDFSHEHNDAERYEKLMECYGDITINEPAKRLLDALNLIADGKIDELSYLQKKALSNHREIFAAAEHNLKHSINNLREAINNFSEQFEGIILDERIDTTDLPPMDQLNSDTRDYAAKQIPLDEYGIRQIEEHAIPMCDALCRKLGIPVATTDRSPD